MQDAAKKALEQMFGGKQDVLAAYDAGGGGKFWVSACDTGSLVAPPCFTDSPYALAMSCILTVSVHLCVPMEKSTTHARKLCVGC